MIQFDFNSIDFDYDKYYEYEKKKNGGKEYILNYLLSQEWIYSAIDFWKSDKTIILLKGCPVDKNLPFSPIETGYIDSKTFKLSRDFILMFHKMINLISYSYKDENKCGLFRNLVPVKNTENMVGSFGSKLEFKLHSDNPTYRLYPEYIKKSLNAPEFLSLFCLRGDTSVKTNIVKLKDILQKLDSDTIEGLKKKIFTVNTPDSFDKYHEITNLPIIIEDDTNNKIYTRYDYHNVKSPSEEGKEFLNEFQKAMNSIKPTSLFFEKGDFLIFKNQEVLHSRESFETKYDGLDRWLIRIYSNINEDYLKHNNILIGGKECL